MGVKIQSLRDSARGERCTLETTNCNHDPDTVVFCHAPSQTAGKATKSHDWWGAYGCSDCHKTLDAHAVGAPYIELFYWLRGIARTQERFYDKGLMTFPDNPEPPAKPLRKTVPRRPLTYTPRQT